MNENNMTQYISKSDLVVEIEKTKEVDFKKEVDAEWNKCNPIDEGMGCEFATIGIEQFYFITKYFFELGLNTQKESKPIEQKTAWSEDSKQRIDSIIASLEGCVVRLSNFGNLITGDVIAQLNDDITYFKTLKNRVQPQPKQELSEDAATHEYIDLGLPSGTLWKSTNEEEYYTYDEATKTFGNQLPSKEQWEELKDKCKWEWKDNGYKITGPNGNTIYLPAAGYHYNTKVNYVGGGGFYWSSTYYDEYVAWYTYFVGDAIILSHYLRDFGLSVRLVK